MDKRIVVTGMGLVSPAFIPGTGSAIQPLSFDIEGDVVSFFGSQVMPFDAALIMQRKGLRRLDRTTRLGLCAAKRALENAGVALDVPLGKEWGLCLGSMLGIYPSRFQYSVSVETEGAVGLNPGVFPNSSANAPGSHISIWFGINGYCAAVATGMTSFYSAMKYAQDQIQSGRSERALVIAAEALTPEMVLFSNRSGLTEPLGEGAGAIILETAESAARAKRNVIAEIVEIGLGYGGDFSGDWAKETAMRQVYDQTIMPHKLGKQETLSLICTNLAPGPVFSVNDNVAQYNIRSAYGELWGATGVIQLIHSITHPSKGTKMLICNNRYGFPAVCLLNQPKLYQEQIDE